MPQNRENPNCPSYQSHIENAADRLYGDVRPEIIASEYWSAVEAEAEIEYQACEGHE